MAACFGLIAGFSTTMLGSGLLGPGIAAAKDLVAVMQYRSPGHRAGGQLADTKPHLPQVGVAGPSVGPLATGVAPLPGPGLVVPAGVVDQPPVYAPDAPFDTEVPFFAEALPPLGGGWIGGGGPGGYLFSGSGGGRGGGGGGGGGGPSPPEGGTLVPPGGGEVVITPPDQTSAVPEPGTWAMMLIGFGAMGRTMRARFRPTLHLPRAIDGE